MTVWPLARNTRRRIINNTNLCLSFAVAAVFFLPFSAFYILAPPPSPARGVLRVSNGVGVGIGVGIRG